MKKFKTGDVVKNFYVVGYFKTNTKIESDLIQAESSLKARKEYSKKHNINLSKVVDFHGKIGLPGKYNRQPKIIQGLNNVW